MCVKTIVISYLKTLVFLTSYFYMCISQDIIQDNITVYEKLNIKEALKISRIIRDY